MALTKHDPIISVPILWQMILALQFPNVTALSETRDRKATVYSAISSSGEVPTNMLVMGFFGPLSIEKEKLITFGILSHT